MRANERSKRKSSPAEAGGPTAGGLRLTGLWLASCVSAGNGLAWAPLRSGDLSLFPE